MWGLNPVKLNFFEQFSNRCKVTYISDLSRFTSAYLVIFQRVWIKKKL